MHHMHDVHVQHVRHACDCTKMFSDEPTNKASESEEAGRRYIMASDDVLGDPLDGVYFRVSSIFILRL